MSAEGVLDASIVAAESALNAAAGSSSLCSISRSGTPMPGVKYPEGAWVALRDVRRAAAPTGDIGAAVEAVRAQWAADLARHKQAGSGADWISYLTGGLDALDALADRLVSPGGLTER